MTPSQLLRSVDPLFLAYLVAFGGAALACLASVPRARRVADRDTRHGLVGLLLTSAGWAAAQFLFLLAPSPGLKTGFYTVGLVVGFSTVGPWLYFCSAYTGRTIHRNRTIQRVALAVFGAITAVKVTNPLHHLYFTTGAVATPFPHLAVQTGLIHWVTMGFSYALAAVGYFMLLELFLQVSYDTKPLVVLATITGLPVVLNVVGSASPSLLDIPYEPLGVAVFALGVCYVYLGRFEAIRLAGNREEPVLILDADGRLRDYNSAAADLFPTLCTENRVGTPLHEAAPDLAAALESDTDVFEIERDGATRYFRVTESAFGAARAQLGRLVGLTDVTHREQYRRDLERQNERLERFASIVSHDLRNPLNVAMGRLELAREEHDSENLVSVANAHARMESLIEDLLTLARNGQPIDERETVSLHALADRSWELVDTGDAELVVEADATLTADPDRLQQLLENLYRNAVTHGGSDVTIHVGALESGFYVEDNGTGIPAEERERVFEYGYTTGADTTGFGLAIVSEIVDAHGWSIRVTESEAGGARFEITGVDRP